jgi:glycosyltransferase involved in cell wall biosynthesis
LPSSRKRIAMLLTNPATYDQRPLKEAHSLAKAGFEVTILAWDRELETKLDADFSDGVRIKRLRLFAGHGTPFLTVPRLLIFYLWALAHLLSSRPDAIHCHDVDTLPAGFAAKAMKLNRVKLTYDMHDLPEAFLRFFPLTTVTQRVFLAGAKKMADAVLVVNDSFVGYLQRLGFDQKKLVVIMNAPPLMEGKRPPHRDGPFKVLYYGWLGEERGVRLLVEAVRGNDLVTLTLAGRGELGPWVVEESKKYPNIVFKGWLPMALLDPLIREADLIPSLYEPKTKNARLATPGKLLTSMAMSLPSLVPQGSFQAELVGRFGCGVIVDWKDTAAVKKAILDLSSDVELYAKYSSAAFEAFQASFSWEATARRLVESYESMLQKG